MADLHRRAAATSTRLSPEEITNRGFASAFRGVSETEVRNFLRRVADEIVAAREAEAQLARQIDDLEEQIRNPTPVTEQQLLSSLGEETARVLRSAQEAAEEIRNRAEERAAALVREAQEESVRLRDEAQKHAAHRTEESEQKATELESEAEARATRLREESERGADALRELTEHEAGEVRAQATVMAEAEIATAKSSSRALVDEARTVRERVLADLGRRRSLLQAQVDELRSGRDRLLDAYRVVKRTLSDATDALAQVEARANAELAAPPARVVVPPVEGELEVLEAAPDDGAPPPSEAEADIDIDLGAEGDVVVIDDAERGGPVSRPGGETPDAEDSGAAVDALFARLRANTAEPIPGATLPAPGPAGEVTAAPEPTDDEAADDVTPEDQAPADEGPADPTPADPTPAAKKVAGTAREERPTEAAVEEVEEAAGEVTSSEVPTSSEDPAEAAEPEILSADDALRAHREEILAPLERDVARRAKRALGDQQNELLDKIRTIKGKVASAQVVPRLDELEAAWEPVLDEPLSSAYASAYAGMAGTEPGSAEVPRDLLAEIAHTMVDPWRQRLASAIDGAADDPDAITQRLGARYREYRGQELEESLLDALAAAWARGAYAAVPDGTLLRWVAAEVGRCPDCDDNALEPTTRSAPFPTGQLFPPAHPGCRCFLVLAEPVATKK